MKYRLHKLAYQPFKENIRLLSRKVVLYNAFEYMIFRKMQIHYSSLETWFVLFVHRDIGCNVVQQQTIQLYSYKVSIR